MSTRGVVAVGTADAWEGRYCGHDADPGTLGAEVFETARRYLQQDGHLMGFQATLLAAGNWDHARQGLICPYCGQRAGVPYDVEASFEFPNRDITSLEEARRSVEERFGTARDEHLQLLHDSVDILLALADEARRNGSTAELPTTREAMEEVAREIYGIYGPEEWQHIFDVKAEQEWEAVQNLRAYGCSDPEQRHHQHSDKIQVMTPAATDWAHIEYGFIVDPRAQTLHVVKGTQIFEGVWTGKPMGSFDLDGAEPDWAALA